ncbi:MAG TPA: LytS/YhcK type 5TM receptor domain-containing protein [Methylomirabilota bacterium]|jgi:signal transduction histidine kinase
MDYHHVIEAAGAISLGMVAFSYLIRWFGEGAARRRRWRPVVTGLVFGLLTVFLMRFRIDVGGDRFVDTRVVTIALATLIEGPVAGAVTAAIAVCYRVWLGGSGAVAGVVGIVATAVAAAVVRKWAQRDGALGLRHASVLVAAVWAITAGSFLMLGERGLAMFAPVWLPLLAMIAVGLAVGARLFNDVAAGQAAEAARRDAAQLRAVTSLARAAAHEINNPLTAVLGGLVLIGRKVKPDSEEARWLDNAKRAAEEIRDIVKQMNRITSIEEVPSAGPLPDMLDIRKSSSSS